MPLDQTPSFIGVLGYHRNAQCRKDSSQPNKSFIGIAGFAIRIRQKDHVHPGIPIGDPSPPSLSQYLVFTDSGLRKSSSEHELSDIDEQTPEKQTPENDGKSQRILRCHLNTPLNPHESFRHTFKIPDL